MGYFIKIRFGFLIFFAPLCFGTIQFKDITQRNYLKIYTATVLCELEPDLPICEPLEIYKVTKLEFDQAIDEGAEQLKELNQRGIELFDSELKPYIQTVCEKRDTVPSYLLPLCELSDLINSVEGNQDPAPLEGALFQPAFNLQTHQGFERIQHSPEFQFIETTYVKMTNIAMGITCDKGQGMVTAFCELTEQITAYDEEFYQPKRVALRDAETELNNQIDILCNDDVDKDNLYTIPLYKQVLCRKQIYADRD